MSPPNEVSEGTMKRAPYVCVCASVRVCVRPCVNEKCYFSSISWPILILFVLSDRAWCGLQNFYTEFWNSLIMQIYGKFIQNQWQKATSLFLGRFWFCLFLSNRAWCGLQNFYTEFLKFINYANLFKINEKNATFSVISWPILILFCFIW